VRKNEVFLSAKDGELQVSRLLPKEVSQFYLFDGEMLDDFEDLVADPTQQSQTIRRSIQQILGVPALENSITDVTDLHKEAIRRQTAAAKTVVASKKDADEAERLSAHVAVYEKDLADMEDDIQAKRDALASTDAQLRAFDLIRADADNLERLRADSERINAQVADLQEERRRALSAGWVDLLTVAIRPRLEALEAERERLIGEDRVVVEVEQRRTVLQATLAADYCEVCGATLGDDRREMIRSALAGLPAYDPPPRERLDKVSASIGRLRSLRATGVGARISAIEHSLSQAIVQRTETGNRITELETKLLDSPVGEVSHLQRQRDRLLREIGGLEDSQKSAMDEMEQLRQAAAVVRNRIAQVSDPELNRLNREVEIYETLLRVFRHALSDLLDDLKTVIEKDSSQVFRELTTDKSYKSLRINDFYGLSILDARGEEVTVRSAGAEQVVALSLIAALNRNAVKSGPVMMDTPFGRLDASHRENIMGFVPKMAEQVVLLVHSGEIDRDRDLASVRSSVEREFELKFVTSSKTELIPLTGTTKGRKRANAKVEAN
jgi:DNA sulfur modification protein DndD